MDVHLEHSEVTLKSLKIDKKWMYSVFNGATILI